MSRATTQTLGGNEYPFSLRIGELRDLQDKCQAGPATILSRLISFQPQAQDIKRPRPDDFGLGVADPDFLAQFNLYATLRSLGGDWRADDVRETIRLGLIGGGMSPTDAFIAVVRHVDERPLTENINLAASILMHALVGEVDDPVGKKPAGKAKAKAPVA